MTTKRNIILLASTLSFIVINYIIIGYYIDSKVKLIKTLETEHKDVNEKYITAQILSQKLENVYEIFENNLAFSKKDKLNDESNMDFLQSITDIFDKNDVKLNQLIPGKKEKKGIYTYIPYVLQFKCDYSKLGKLIVSLENNNRYITIDNIMLRNEVDNINKGKGDNLSFLNQDIEMKIYTVTINKAKKL